MCIFCGGQCGGLGDLFISLGLPVAALYFYRLKSALLKLKNRLWRRGPASAAQASEEHRCSCCGEPLIACRTLALQAVDPTSLAQVDLETHFKPAAVHHQGIKAKAVTPLGVRGWLLFLCLNLTIIIPCSCLYNAITAFQMVYFPSNRSQLLILQQSPTFHLIIILAMLFLACFSLYAGRRLWEAKPQAVKIAKIFLFSQLGLIFIIITLRPWLVFSLTGESAIEGIIRGLIPYLSYFGVWFLYLTFSKRVHNTYAILAA